MAFGKEIRFGVVMPAVLQNEDMLAMTLDTLRSIKVVKPMGEPGELKYVWTFHLMCNRLSVRTVADLVGDGERGGKTGLVVDALKGNHDRHGPFLVEVVNDRERTVAGAWNEGARRAILKGADFVMVMANDALPCEGTVEKLLCFGRAAENYDVALWSACQGHLSLGDAYATDGADFSMFMFRPRTLALHGYFDENFKPAYYEDNDYYARVVLGGEKCRVVHAARYDHLGSQTQARDPEMAHHIRHWFPLNREYFVRKWGREPAGTEGEVRATYHKTPFNAPGRPLSWWELETSRR